MGRAVFNAHPCGRCSGGWDGVGVPSSTSTAAPRSALKEHPAPSKRHSLPRTGRRAVGHCRPDMPLASGRETGSQSQWAPYQEPLSNTRPPAPPELSRNVLRPVCRLVGPCSDHVGVGRRSWQICHRRSVRQTCSEHTRAQERGWGWGGTIPCKRKRKSSTKKS